MFQEEEAQEYQPKQGLRSPNQESRLRTDQEEVLQLPVDPRAFSTWGAWLTR